MIQHLKDFYPNPNEDRINFGILNRDFDKSLSTYVIDCFKSIETVLPEIKLVDSEFIVDVNDIDLNDYERSRKKNDTNKYVYVNDDRVGELRLHFDITLPEDCGRYVIDVLDNSTTKTTKKKSSVNAKIKPEQFYTDEQHNVHMKADIKMIVPIPDDKGYYFINGKRYISIYQLSESSTYVKKSSVIQKSLMPIEIRRSIGEFKDVEKNIYNMYYYEVKSFNKFRNIFYLFFSKMGFIKTLEYFGVSKYIRLGPVEKHTDPDFAYFRPRSDVSIRIHKNLLNNEYIRSIMGTILNAITSRMDIDSIMSKDHWIQKLGSSNGSNKSDKNFHYVLGVRQLMLSNRMLDEATKSVLRFDDSNKTDAYAIIRCIVQNFKEFKSKDNLNILNKRLRCNEYIASLLNAGISEKIKQFINKTTKTPADVIKKYKDLLNYRGTELIAKAHASGLIRTDDIVNDLDFFQKLKITTKGPNSLGSKDSRTVSVAYRSLHPSHIGKLDLNVCSASEPGLTNILVPMVETDGLYFSDSPSEPETGIYDFKKEMGEFNECETIEFDPVKYNAIVDFAVACVRSNELHRK